MKYFAIMTIHPLKMDGVPTPGSPLGRPTNETDTTRLIHSCGTDSFHKLDGRKTNKNRRNDALTYVHGMRKIRKYAGFEIHRGDLRSSTVVEAYRVTDIHEDGLTYQSLPGMGRLTIEIPWTKK